jgi:hypothetical protein
MDLWTEVFSFILISLFAKVLEKANMNDKLLDLIEYLIDRIKSMANAELA